MGRKYSSFEHVNKNKIAMKFLNYHCTEMSLTENPDRKKDSQSAGFYTTRPIVRGISEQSSTTLMRLLLNR